MRGRGGGGGVLSTLGPTRKAGSGGEGGGAARSGPIQQAGVGGGVLSASGSIRKAGRGGGGDAVHLRPDTKSVGGGGGCCPALHKKRGGGLQPPNLQTPPPPPPWIRLWFDVIAFKCLMRLMRFIRLGAREKICPGPGLALGGPVCTLH